MDHALPPASPVRVRRTFRFRIAADGVALTAVLWAVLFGIALIHRGTTWPRASPAIPKGPGFPGRPATSAFEAWENFLTLWFVVEFLLLKSWAMIRRAEWDGREIDWLAVSLVAANLAFAAVYLFALGQALVGWQAGVWTRRLLIRDPLVLILAWGIVMLCRVPDRPGEE